MTETAQATAPFLRRLCGAAAAAALVALPVQKAQADMGDALLGAAVGAFVGAAAANSNNKKKSSSGSSRTYSKPRAPQISAAQREENRQVQAGLNELNCDAGAPDGIFGRRTREAIRCFQVRINEPVTGELTPVQKASIILYYDKVKNGEVNTASTSRAKAEQALPYGAQALFDALATRTAEAGPVETPAQPNDYGTPVNYGVTQDVPSAPPAPNLVTDGTGTVQIPRPEPEPAAATPGFDIARLCGPELSLASATASNSLGFATATTPQPAAQDNSAFCAISADFRAMATQHMQNTGLGLPALAEECRGLLAPTVEIATPRLADTPPSTVMDMVFDTNASLLPLNEQVVQGLRTCVGLGYAAGDSDLIEGAALYAAAIGDYAPTELLGWHMAYGIGGSTDAGAAGRWLRFAAENLPQTPPQFGVFGGPDRGAVLMQAAQRLNPDRLGGTKVGSLFGEVTTQEFTGEEAESYFTVATRTHQKLSRASMTALGLSVDEVLELCAASADVLDGTPSAVIYLRTCRHAAYVGRDPDLMLRMDETLAGMGDPASAEALAMHDAMMR